MKKIDLKRVLALAVILAFIVPFTMNAQGKPDFSGSWTLNTEKSTMPQGGQGGQGGGGGMRAGGMGASMTVKQDATSLTVESVRPNRDGGTTPVTTKYTLDGKETTNESNFGSSKSAAKWSADNKTIVVTTTRSFERDGQTTNMTTTQEWTMNGTNLQIKSTTKTPNGDRTTTMVYDKK